MRTRNGKDMMTLKSGPAPPICPPESQEKGKKGADTAGPRSVELQALPRTGSQQAFPCLFGTPLELVWRLIATKLCGRR